MTNVNEIINWDKIPEGYNTVSFDFSGNDNQLNVPVHSGYITVKRPVKIVEEMRYTSILHCHNINYQSNFKGSKVKVIIEFMEECNRKDVEWAKLFSEKTGELIKHYLKGAI